MVKRGATPDGAKGETVDLLVGLERVAREFDADIAQHTGVVVIVITAMPCARAALDLHLALVVAGLAAEDHSTPVSRLSVAGFGF